MTKNPGASRIRITPRDIQVIREIDEHGFRAFSELRSSSLKSYSRVWAWQLMKRLAKAKLIDEVRTGDGSLLGWKSTDDPLLRDFNADTSGKINRGKAPRYGNSFYHDQEVRWALDQLKNLSSISQIKTESKLKEDAFSGRGRLSLREMKQVSASIPDASFILKVSNDPYRVAFEMELNRKSNKRVELKLEHYIAKNEYDLILYVCGNDAIERHLKRIYEHVLETSPQVRFTKKRGLIYFTQLQNLKADFKKAVFIGPNDDFYFQEIA